MWQRILNVDEPLIVDFDRIRMAAGIARLHFKKSSRKVGDLPTSGGKAAGAISGDQSDTIDLTPASHSPARFFLAYQHRLAYREA